MCVHPAIPKYKTYNTYLEEIKRWTVTGCQVARENLASTSESQSDYCNQGQKFTTLKVNDEVLVMLPERSDTLLTSWQGPFTMVKWCSPANHLTDVRGNQKLFPVNMLKIYFVREKEQVEEISTSPSEDGAMANSVFVTDDMDETDDGFQEGCHFWSLNRRRHGTMYLWTKTYLTSTGTKFWQC